MRKRSLEVDSWAWCAEVTSLSDIKRLIVFDGSQSVLTFVIGDKSNTSVVRIFIG